MTALLNIENNGAMASIDATQSLMVSSFNTMDTLESLANSQITQQFNSQYEELLTIINSRGISSTGTMPKSVRLCHSQMPQEMERLRIQNENLQMNSTFENRQINTNVPIQATQHEVIPMYPDGCTEFICKCITVSKHQPIAVNWSVYTTNILWLLSGCSDFSYTSTICRYAFTAIY